MHNCGFSLPLNSFTRVLLSLQLLVIPTKYSWGLVYFAHHHICKLQTLSHFASSTTEVQVLARRVFIGVSGMSMDQVHAEYTDKLLTPTQVHMLHYKGIVCPTTAF